MIYIAIFVLVFTLIQLLVALTNLLIKTHLPSSGINSDRLVSILIPARNEEKNIGNILDDIKSQNYNNIEVIIFNDNSDDLTAEIVTKYTISDSRFRLINSDHLPAGWSGKNHACHSMAAGAKGQYLLFLDADVRIGNDLISDAVQYAEKSKTGLISIFPEQIIESFGEEITVPNMNYILLSLLPLPLVRLSPFPSLAAANGQFMFFNADIYRNLKPHELMKASKVEDIEISRYLKKNNISVACLLGDKRIRCRMYSGFSDSVNGFSKNVVAFFGNSFILAVIFWLITSLGFLAVIMAVPRLVLIAYLVSYIITRVLISIASHQNVLKNLLYMLPLQFSLGLFIRKAFINRYFGKFEWKGRSLN